MFASMLGPFGLSDLLSFIAGMLVVIVWKNVTAMVHNRRHPLTKVSLPRLNARWIGVLVIVLAVIGVFFSTLQASEDQKAFAAKTEACQREFTTVINVRADINAASEKLRQQDRDSLVRLVVGLVNPPPEIDVLSPDDPLRQQYNYKLTAQFLAESNAIQRQRDEAAAALQRNQYPQPSCGKDPGK